MLLNADRSLCTVVMTVVSKSLYGPVFCSINHHTFQNEQQWRSWIGIYCLLSLPVQETMAHQMKPMTVWQEQTKGCGLLVFRSPYVERTADEKHCFSS